MQGNWSAPSMFNLNLTQANCRYVAPFYNSIWQQMKIKKAPSCKAVLNYYTWTKFTRSENNTASDYYSSRLNRIDDNNQLFNARLDSIDNGLSVISDVLDPDLRKVLSPANYQSTANILKSKGIIQSLKAGQTPFKLNTLKGRFLNNTFKGIILDKGIKQSSEFLCQQLLSFDGAVAQSCMTESSKIADCTFSLVESGWEGAASCVTGVMTSFSSLIYSIFDVTQVVSIKQHINGYLIINDYLNDYYAKGSTTTSLNEAKLETDIQGYANQLNLTNSLFDFDDYDMQFVKDGIRDSITRNLITANHNVSLAEQLRKILNK